MEDSDIIFDLRAHNGRSGATQYDVFWDECQKFLNEEEAVDDRRHGVITHLARAISIRDFVDQVSLHACISSYLICCHLCGPCNTVVHVY